jgi:hypothetical protein
VYAQLVTELEQKRRYWFNDEENQRIMRQNEHFQLVSNYEQMVSLTYLPPEETPVDANHVLLQDIMQRLAEDFPTFNITKGTDMELGRRLVQMGYVRKRQNQGSAFRIKEK